MDAAFGCISYFNAARASSARDQVNREPSGHALFFSAAIE